jgi:hypothetical protein
MSSATGIPENIEATMSEHGEQEPLLGRPGDASQPHGKPIYENLILGSLVQHSNSDLANASLCDLGTGVVVQAGIWIV